MLNSIKEWQGLIGAIIGASAPFVLWWIVEIYQRRCKHNDGLYLLERYFVDQINTLIETQDTVDKFLCNQLVDLISNVKSHDEKSYSINQAFFPLFSIRPLPIEIHSINTKSGYLDNKVAKVYKISQDMPLIIDDLRRQFEHTLQLNRELCISKLNQPEVQRDSYIENINRYISIVRHELIEQNIPTYLKALVEVRVSLAEIKKIGPMRWRVKFNPKYHYYISKKKYNEDKNFIFENIDTYFKGEVVKSLEEIEKTRQRS